jgi:hypothetical protein
VTLSRGMSGRRTRAVVLAGCLALLLTLFGGVEGAFAGPPAHAGPSGGPGSSGDGEVSAASHDEGPANSAPGRSGQAPGNSGQSRGNDQAPGNAGQSRGSAGQSRGNGGPSRGNDQAPGNAGQARGRPADSAPGQQPDAGRPSNGPGSTPEPAGPPEGRGGQPTEPSAADDTPAADEQETVAPQREPGPANGADAPFVAETEPESTSPGGGPPSGGATSAAPPEPTVDLEEPAGVAAPDLEAANEGPIAEAHLFERISRGTSRAVDTMFSPTRDFGVPVLLVAALAAYLLFHRRLDRGSLPMTGLAATHDGSPTHARFEL